VPRVSITTNPALTGFVVIDATVLIAAYDPTHDRHALVSAFLKHAGTQVLAGQCELFMSDLAVQELAHFIVRTGLQNDVLGNLYPTIRNKFDALKQSGQIKKNSSFDWHRLQKMDPQTVFVHVPKVTQALAILRATPITVVEPELIGDPGFSIVDRMRDNMMTYGLLPADAYHIAIANAIDAKTLVSTDGDWLLTEQDFTVIGIV
jgi:predicted nucleic acid-binding protein